MNYLIHCKNDKCKHYFEDGCFNDETKMIVIDENGNCESFKQGKSELYETNTIDLKDIDERLVDQTRKLSSYLKFLKQDTKI